MKKGKTRVQTIHNLPQVQMTLKDIKRECIIRGMPFEQVVNTDLPNLYYWWQNNSQNPIDQSLLDKYDDWLEGELAAIGQHGLIHPSLRFNYVNKEEEVKKKTKVIKEKKPRKKREKNKLGLYSGTKKAMTYESCHKGWSLKKTIRKVKRAFPDAQEKSIKIWYNKATKEMAK